MTEMVHLRNTLLQKEEEIGVRISYTDLFVMVMARAVQHVPLVNSSLTGDEIKIWEEINIGVAVALEKGEYESGLIVPVVKNVDKISLTEISRTVRDLSTRAGSGQLALDDVSGGTITLSDMGMFVRGWMVSTPILNEPESVIGQQKSHPHGLPRPLPDVVTSCNPPKQETNGSCYLYHTQPTPNRASAIVPGSCPIRLSPGQPRFPGFTLSQLDPVPLHEF
jgi:hypothetical protein